MGNKSYSKAISWIDDCRIPYVDTNEYQKRDAYKEQTIYGNGKGMPLVYWETNSQGRFPANILVSDDMLNDGIITKQNPRKYKADMDIKETSLLGFGDTKDKIQQGDKGSNSRYYNIDKWFNNLIDV